MESIRKLVDYVKKAGDLAFSRQSRVLRSMKQDGSVVTEIDKKLNQFLSEAIRKEFSNVNIITEEADSEYDPSLPFSFAIDPVDGTDSFSQQMPGWCVSAGLLKGSVPAAGIVYAPSWGAKGGTLIVSDLDGTVELNGKLLEWEDLPPDSEGFQVLAGSRVFRKFDLRAFEGKFRSVGSTVIDMIGPLIHRNVKAAVVHKAYIWDIAAAHAILINYGLKAEYADGRPIDYAPLLERKATTGFILSGFPAYGKIVKEAIHF